jgi:hypothetical protein
MAKKNAMFPKNSQRNCLMAKTANAFSVLGSSSESAAEMITLPEVSAEYSVPASENQD